jgi:hypothetical protein
MARASKGIINESITTPNKIFFPGNLNFANAKPAIPLIKHPKKIHDADTSNEFRSGRPKCRRRKIFLYDCDVHSTGINVFKEKGVLYLNISTSVLKDEKNIHTIGRRIIIHIITVIKYINNFFITSLGFNCKNNNLSTFPQRRFCGY